MSRQRLVLITLMGCFIVGSVALTNNKVREAAAGTTVASDQVMQSVEIKAVERELKHSIEQFRKGMVEADAGLIRHYSSTNLSFGHSNGVVQTLDEFVDTLESQTEIFKRVALINRNLKVAGRIAIERHHFSADIVYKGELKNFELEVVEVWEKSDHWRLLVRQALCPGGHDQSLYDHPRR